MSDFIGEIQSGEATEESSVASVLSRGPMLTRRVFGYRFDGESGDWYLCRSCYRTRAPEFREGGELVTTDNVCGLYTCASCGQRLWRSWPNILGWVFAFATVGAGLVLSLGLGEGGLPAALFEGTWVAGVLIFMLRTSYADRGGVVIGLAVLVVAGLVAWWIGDGWLALEGSNWLRAIGLLLLPVVIFGLPLGIWELAKLGIEQWRSRRGVRQNSVPFIRPNLAVDRILNIPPAKPANLQPRQAEGRHGGMHVIRGLGFGMRALVVAYVLAVAAACVYVPWAERLPRTNRSLGYDFLWSPPQGPYGPYGDVDLSRLVLELVTMTALFAGVFVAFLMGRFRDK